MKILITGGAGYIGSHTLVELANANYDFIVYDNLCNSSQESLKRVEKIIAKPVEFVQGDIRDKAKLQELFASHDIDSVIHFAGLKAVGKSVENPLEYYDNNVNGTLVLLEVMKEHNFKKIVFSSSATVYTDPAIYSKLLNIQNSKFKIAEYSPLREDSPTGDTTDPYGTNLMLNDECLILNERVA